MESFVAKTRNMMVSFLVFFVGLCLNVTLLFVSNLCRASDDPGRGALPIGMEWKYFWVQKDQQLFQCDLKQTSSCTQGACLLECVLEGLGVGQWDQTSGRIRWTASGSTQRIGGLGVGGAFALKMSEDHKPRVLSHGFQSWSYSGLLEAPPPRTLASLVAEDLTPEAMRHEEFRDGTGPSWEFSALVDLQQFFFVGAITAERWSSWVRFGWSPVDARRVAKDDRVSFSSLFDPPQGDGFPFKSLENITALSTPTHGTVEVILVSGMNGDEIEVPAGQVVSSEQWMMQQGMIEQLSATLNTYRQAMDQASPETGLELESRSQTPKNLDESHHGPTNVQLGWNSWYHLWNRVSQKDVTGNLEKIGPFFESLTFPFVAPEKDSVESFHRAAFLKERASQVYPPFATIDDGWQVRWGEWTPNNKFAPEFRTIAQEIESRGFAAGLWLAPFLVDVKSPLILQHPDWFVGTADFSHPSGVYKILDITHPAVREHLEVVFSRLREASIKFVKLDFLYTATFPGQRYRSVTSIEAYREGMALIRRVLGDEVVILACGAPQLPSRPYVDRWRIGPDIAYQFPKDAPIWVDTAIQARNIGARSFLCDRSPQRGKTSGRSFACDSDPWLVRGRRKGREIQSSLWVSALTGSGLILSDDFHRVPVESLDINLSLQAAAQALSGKAAHPDFPAWIAQNPTHRLFGAGLWERLWDTGASAINAPLAWNLEHEPASVLINFTPQTLVAPNGVKIYPRGSYMKER